MSRQCAKPICSEPAVAWLEIARDDRRVVVRSVETPFALGLCEVHRDRFAVPDGWSLDTEQSTATPVVPDSALSAYSDESFDPVASPTDSDTSAARPWFLAGSSTEVSHPSPLLAPIDEEPLPPGELSAGSLLRRAFHGPNRSDDVHRRSQKELDANEVDQDELETRRIAKVLDDYGTAQLPFPPLATERQAAVS